MYCRFAKVNLESRFLKFICYDFDSIIWHDIILLNKLSVIYVIRLTAHFRYDFSFTQIYFFDLEKLGATFHQK